MLRDMIQTIIVSQETRKIQETDQYYYVYFFPYYGGLILSAILWKGKRVLVSVFTIITCVGIIVLAWQDLLVKNDKVIWIGIGTGLINFSGGYYEGMTPLYCIFRENFANA